MQDKENIYTQENQTEQGSKVSGAQGAESMESGSTDLGKFKDVNALMQAYKSLQAEFTRRSQRLKKCEEELENRGHAARSEAADGDVVACGADAPCEAERRPSSAVEEGVENDDGGTAAATSACADGKEYSMAVVENGNDAGGFADKRETPSLYEQVMADESVRLKIVGDYLSSIGKGGAPLVKGGGGVLATPPKKPSNISEAGNMALAYLRAQNEQA